MRCVDAPIATAKRDGPALALGLACLLAAPADARTITFYSMGIGKSSCQKYMDASKDLEADHFRTLLKEGRTFMSENDIYDEYIRGVVSGINYASAESGRHPVIRPTSVEVITWMRSWCGSHPDTTVINAVLSYLLEKHTGSPIGVPSPPTPAVAASAAAPQAAVPQAVPASAATPPAATQFVFVIFQKDIAAADRASFLKDYHVAIDDGPNPDGYYRLRLAEPLAPDQLNAMLDSMRGQAKIVSMAVQN